jgi:hypothetical protein
MDAFSLLRGLKGKEIEKLNKKGIFTVTQYAYTYRPRRQRKKRHEGNVKHDFALQALAIRDNKTYVFSKPDLPSPSLKIFVDVESVPYANFYYLIGVLLIEENKSKYVYFWANAAEQQGEIWLEFLRFLKPMNNFTVFHYGSFETRFFKRMAKEHDGYSDVAEKVISNSHNVLSDIYGHIYYPSYSRGLKFIAKLLGHSWPTDNPTWVENFQWWHAWNDSRCNHLKNKIVEYNRNDCLALKTVFDDLVKITKAERNGLSEGYEESTEIKTDLPFERARRSFPSQAVEKIRKCAYFDYQMSKVNIGKRGRAEKVSQGKSVPVCELKINKTITHYQPKRCVVCQSPKIRLDKECSKVLCDLYIGKDTVKKYTVKHTARSFFCNSCKKHSLPKTFKDMGRSKFGWNLQSWVVYKMIRLMNSYSDVSDEAEELFGYVIRRNINEIKKRFAVTYSSTYQDLLDVICKGDLLHVDETKVSVEGQNGYVWVFANYKAVAYLYTETRQGDFLKDLLKGFSGVLISDFYAAYDSIDCPQQKCLIHLVRKINDDVFRNPFDDELKALAKEFTELLQPIIETIDRRGLEKVFLQKHLEYVQAFMEQLVSRQYNSAVTKTHVKRILKNREKLFTFLNYDNVTWNNNFAEHAVKRFVYLRKKIGGSSTQKGVQEYLILLSLCETLRLNNLSFLSFLKAQATDISAYINDKAN